jgi:hypothetical protein
VTYDDVLDPSVQPFLLSAAEVVAQGAQGRTWTLLAADADTIGGTEIVQFPDLATQNVTGIGTGAWSVRVDARTWLAVGSTSTDFLLAERRRTEITFARSAAVTFTVQ